MPAPTFPFLLPGFDIEHVLHAPDQILIKASAKAETATCPSCATASSQIHSHYERKPRDLPLCQHTLRLQLRVHRFQCRNSDCTKQIFVQRLNGLVKPYARRTERLTQALRHIGFALGGQAGARLARALAMPVSGETLLRIVHRTPLPPMPVPRVVGVDDWAWRKGTRYGTLLVDLETHRPIDLLPDRSAQTLATWLSAHPSIEILTRDRSPEYAQAMLIAAPQAIQVADRWHLLRNLREVTERILLSVYDRILKLPQLTQAQILEHQTFARSPGELQAQEERRKRHQQRYDDVMALHAKGLPLQRIAQTLGLSRTTVHRYVNEGGVPYRKHRGVRASILDPYRSYLEARLEEGCENARQLWREIRAAGFEGSHRQVSRWLYARRRQPAPSTPHRYRARILERTQAAASAPDMGLVLPRVQGLARLLTTPAKRHEMSEQVLVRFLSQEPMIKLLYELVQRLVQMLHGQSAETFGSWFSACIGSGIAQLERFAQQLFRDRAAVEAAMRLPWSQGQVEGQINRLKVIKRQMYGRAGLALLRQRVLYRS